MSLTVLLALLPRTTKVTFLFSLGSNAVMNLRPGIKSAMLRFGSTASIYFLWCYEKSYDGPRRVTL